MSAHREILLSVDTLMPLAAYGPVTEVEKDLYTRCRSTSENDGERRLPAVHPP